MTVTVLSHRVLDDAGRATVQVVCWQQCSTRRTMQGRVNDSLQVER